MHTACLAVTRLIVVAALVTAVALSLASCGPGYGTGVIVGGAYWDNYYDDWYYNGDRRGDYVFYRGRWYLYGIGTPYEWDPYWDPYIYP